MVLSRLAQALAALLTIVTVSVPAATPHTTRAVSSNPTTVTIAGSFNAAIGCGGDWQPDCEAARLSDVAETDV